MPYNGVEWVWPFQVRTICLHLERESALQIPVDGLPVPGEFHGTGLGATPALRLKTKPVKYYRRILLFLCIIAGIPGNR